MNFSIDYILASSVATTPLLFLLVVGLLLMMMDTLFKAQSSMPLISALGFIGSSGLALFSVAEKNPFFGMIETGNIAPLVHIFLCLSGLFTLFFLQDYLKRQEKPIYEVYPLLVFSVIGMIMMANAGDLIMTFIGLETFSIALYVFAALFKKESASNEAGIKYFLLGAFASAFLLFGISIIYGITGATNFEEIAKNAAKFNENLPLFYTGMGLLLVGFLFKVSAFPFHSWTPDVYQGTPTPLAGFMATGSKMAVFISMGAVLIKMNFTAHQKIVDVLAISAVLTMIYGNIVAARQSNLKRMLAYSSIAHSGYVMLGLCAGKDGFMAVIFYMFIYTLMNIGAFGLVGIAEKQLDDTEVNNWKGLGMKAPYFAAAMSLFLFSLAGIPPLAGFMSKYQIFISAIRADLVGLAVIGILTSVVAAYYYINVIVVMYFGKDEKAQVSPVFGTVPALGIAILAILILVLGVAPSLVLTPLEHFFSGTVATAVAIK